jgi:hypothetical protein
MDVSEGPAVLSHPADSCKLRFLFPADNGDGLIRRRRVKRKHPELSFQTGYFSQLGLQHIEHVSVSLGNTKFFSVRRCLFRPEKSNRSIYQTVPDAAA